MSLTTQHPFAESWFELPDGTLHWLKDRCTVGRQADCDLVLADASVSRHHAMITGGPEGYVASDLRSRNGTYVNRVPVVRPTLLRDGDELRVGQVALRYRCLRRVESQVQENATVMPTAYVEEIRDRSCWLLLADLAGYSALIAEHGSKGALERFQGWIAGMRPLIERNGGLINSYVGDSVFAWWPDQPEAADGLRTALARMEAWRPQSPARFRVIVHHGTAFFTRSERGEELSGQEVNFTFRADKVAKAFGAEAMLSEAAMRRLGLESSCRPLGEAAIDGIAGRFAFFAPATAGS